MIKHFYLAATFIGGLTACGNATNGREVESKTDTAVVQNGLPLDNIHRSRGKDSVENSPGDKKEGVPLDNLDRGKGDD
ncbi:MAG: hypothetical protein LBJ04_21075 [Sphingobacterium sp.]|jgi:hypothetical protein|uniref:hypothetical protein n=1 Tax=Sphingobacterium sp. TaxID=341027 RepID=UPI002827EE2A|nr:hypothetical protein [Sphingobacterium sp.]MDR0265720.1 hypothetical protein [Sphingobacterium sp.]